jgi:tetratricopeptide (TPR) repeat protein
VYLSHHSAASEYAKSASKIYRNLGYTGYEHGRMDESMNLFTKAIDCSKYFNSKIDIDHAKNLQGLALIHAEKGEYEISKPLIKEASSVVLKYGFDIF